MSLLLSMADMVGLVYRNCGVYEQCWVCMACWSVKLCFGKMAQDVGIVVIPI